MNEKNTARRARPPKREEKPSASDYSKLPREELPCTYETISGCRYTLHVGSSSLANAPVLG